MHQKINQPEPFYLTKRNTGSLERPCVNHLYPDQDTVHEVGGHALTLSGQLAPAYPKSVFESHRAHETFCREVPEQSLHSLLTLSSELCPESEITPIEAWHSIRSLPLFGGLGAQNLWHLAEKLRDAATCHGYVVLSVLVISAMC